MGHIGVLVTTFHLTGAVGGGIRVIAGPFFLSSICLWVGLASLHKK